MIHFARSGFLRNLVASVPPMPPPNDPVISRPGYIHKAVFFLTDPDWKDKDEACSSDRAGETQIRYLKLVETYKGTTSTFE